MNIRECFKCLECNGGMLFCTFWEGDYNSLHIRNQAGLSCFLHYKASVFGDLPSDLAIATDKPFLSEDKARFINFNLDELSDSFSSIFNNISVSKDCKRFLDQYVYDLVNNVNADYD